MADEQAFLPARLRRQSGQPSRCPAASGTQQVVFSVIIFKFRVFLAFLFSGLPEVIWRCLVLSVSRSPAAGYSSGRVSGKGWPLNSFLVLFSVLRSVVYQQSSKESATLQPFFTLQLDIQSDKIRTVQDALESLVARESVQGYTTKTKQEVYLQSISNVCAEALVRREVCLRFASQTHTWCTCVGPNASLF